MAVRSVVQVLAGAVAGAVLVGVPTWAAASGQNDSPSSDPSSMMSGANGQRQMMDSMSKMMDDPKLREQMRSMMSDSMGGMKGSGTSGMGQMGDMGTGSKSGGTPGQ